jgi:hypothetical protein
MGTFDRQVPTAFRPAGCGSPTIPRDSTRVDPYCPRGLPPANPLPGGLRQRPQPQAARGAVAHQLLAQCRRRIPRADPTERHRRHRVLPRLSPPGAGCLFRISPHEHVTILAPRSSRSGRRSHQPRRFRTELRRMADFDRPAFEAPAGRRSRRAWATTEPVKACRTVLDRPRRQSRGPDAQLERVRVHPDPVRDRRPSTDCSRSASACAGTTGSSLTSTGRGRRPQGARQPTWNSGATGDRLEYLNEDWTDFDPPGGVASTRAPTSSPSTA